MILQTVFLLRRRRRPKMIVGRTPTRKIPAENLESREKERAERERSIDSISERAERPPFVRENVNVSRPNQTDRQMHHEGLRKFCLYRFLVSDRGFAREKKKTARLAEREDRFPLALQFAFQFRIAKRVDHCKKDVCQFLLTYKTIIY